MKAYLYSGNKWELIFFWTDFIDKENDFSGNELTRICSVLKEAEYRGEKRFCGN